MNIYLIILTESINNDEKRPEKAEDISTERKNIEEKLPENIEDMSTKQRMGN